MDFLNKEEYVYMDCNIRMSTRALADLLYAAIITKSGLPSSFGVGIYGFKRDQNCYNHVDVKVHIHPSKIEEFQFQANTKLYKPIQIKLN